MKLYTHLAAWWPLLSSPADYEEEAAFYSRVIIDAAESPPRTVLELGSGGGNNASHMKSHFDLVLVDVSPGMLDVSRRLNPDLSHVQGDMRTVRLDRQFDAVFVHDAVCYMTTADDLRKVMATAFVHCKPGGVVLFAPDFVRENFKSSSDHGGHDAGKGNKGLRYLEWTWDPDPADSQYQVDYVYLLREADGSIRAEHDRHYEGLFSRGDWLQWLTDAGFEPRVVPFEHSEIDLCTLEVFVGRRQ